MSQIIKRQIAQRLISALDRGKSVLLLGPRQTGKTTLLETIPHDLDIPLLIPKERQHYELDPGHIIKEVEALKPKDSLPVVLVDEIQKVPTLLDPIRYLIDKRKAQFILTGSSARKIKAQSDLNLLPGRVVAFRMDALNLTEFQGQSIEEFLIFGSLPGICTRGSHAEKDEDLVSYVETYLEEEIRKEAATKNLPAFYRFLELAALEAGQIMSLRALSQEIGISHVTIGGYIEILHDSLIIDRIDPFSESTTRKKLAKSPKFLFFDLGVRRTAAREGIHLGKHRLGGLFEQYVGIELLRLMRAAGLRDKLSFWRDPDGPEVDWLIQTPAQLIPIEVKFKDKPLMDDARHLLVFLNEYRSAKMGFIVSTTPRSYNLAKNVRVISWKELPTVFESIA